jgi:hypothetical protein
MMGHEHPGGCGEMDGSMMWMHHLPMKMKKDFKLSMLRKKEKMLEAKLAFVREMKDMVEKWQPAEEEMKK